jgi:hypothetical protein
MTVKPLAFAALVVVLPVQAQDLAASAGKQRAGSSRIEWDTRDAGHPVLGTIRFAYIKNPVETATVGNNKVYSRAYVSCEKTTKRFAIELSNTVSPDDPGGLRPVTEPRLVCVRPTAPGREVQEPLLANFDIEMKTGDALARGLRAFPLRECAAIRVFQEVALPATWTQKTAKLEFEILPYDRQVDSIFATCGERSAYGPAPAAPTVTAAAPPKPAVTAPPPPPPQAKTAPPPTTPAQVPPAPQKPAPPPVVASVPPAASTPASAPGTAPVDGWQVARVVTSGKTNVRAGPRLESSVVTMLDPGAMVLVQRTGNEWWRARQFKGTAFDGYIREDRLTFK